MDDGVTIRLSMDEALVFFDWLATANEKDALDALPAEKRVLWDIEAMLEPQLPMLFDPNYSALVDVARREVEDESE